MEVKDLPIAIQSGGTIVDLKRSAYEMYELFDFFWSVKDIFSKEQQSVVFERLYKRYVRRGSEEKILLQAINILECRINEYHYKDMEFVNNFLAQLKERILLAEDYSPVHICLLEIPYSLLLGTLAPPEDFDNLKDGDDPFWQRPNYIFERYINT